MRHEVARRTEETNRLQTEIENVRRAEAHQYKEVGIAFLIASSSRRKCVGGGSFLGQHLVVVPESVVNVVVECLCEVLVLKCDVEIFPRCFSQPPQQQSYYGATARQAEAERERDHFVSQPPQQQQHHATPVHVTPYRVVPTHTEPPTSRPPSSQLGAVYGRSPYAELANFERTEHYVYKEVEFEKKEEMKKAPLQKHPSFVAHCRYACGEMIQFWRFSWLSVILLITRLG